MHNGWLLIWVKPLLGRNDLVRLLSGRRAIGAGYNATATSVLSLQFRENADDS